MTDLIEKVARAIEHNITVEPEAWLECARFDETARVAIEVVLREQRAWAEALPKPNFSPVAVEYIDGYARENNIDLEKP